MQTKLQQPATRQRRQLSSIQATIVALLITFAVIGTIGLVLDLIFILL